jgi:DNA-binding NtrC family response regulator
MIGGRRAHRRRTSHEPAARILLVEGDPRVRWQIARVLARRDVTVCEEGDGATAARRLAVEPFDLVLADLAAPGTAGRVVLEEVVRTRPSLPVVVFSRDADVVTAVEAVKAGAWDVLTLPLAPSRLLAIVDEALTQPPMATRGATTVELLAAHGRSMRQLVRLVTMLSGTSAPVVISGPPGCGKMTVAKELHRLSPRREHPFVGLELASLMRQDGPATDLTKRVLDASESAAAGTLCLRGLSDLPLETQAQVAATLSGRETVRCTEAARLVTLSNEPCSQLLDGDRLHPSVKGLFGSAEVQVPPLRERPAAIPLLAARFLGDACERIGRPAMRLSPKAVELLLLHDWPENLRELRRVMGNVAASAVRSPLRPHELAAFLPPLTPDAVLESREDHERAHIEAVLLHTHGNISRAAAVLGITRATLYRKVRKYGLDGSVVTIQKTRHQPL